MVKDTVKTQEQFIHVVEGFTLHQFHRSSMDTHCCMGQLYIAGMTYTTYFLLMADFILHLRTPAKGLAYNT